MHSQHSVYFCAFVFTEIKLTWSKYWLKVYTCLYYPTAMCAYLDRDINLNSRPVIL